MAEETANIYRVNKLLELEAADWQRQLDKAVGGLRLIPSSLLISHSMDPDSDLSNCCRASLIRPCPFMRPAVCFIATRKGLDTW